MYSPWQNSILITYHSWGMAVYRPQSVGKLQNSLMVHWILPGVEMGQQNYLQLAGGTVAAWVACMVLSQ